MKIPKIAHFIWGNQNGLPYSRFLSIATFARLNPEFKVFYHTFDNSGGIKGFGLRGQETVCQTFHTDNTNRLALLQNIEVVKHNYLHGTNLNHAPTFMSDLLRYYLLGSEGGYYFDTDILFFKSIRDSYLCSGMYTDITAIINHTKNFSPTGAYRIGVLASQARSRLFKDAYTVARWSLDPEEYQSAGSETLQSVLGGARVHRRFDSTYPDEIIHNLLDSFAYKYNHESMKAILSNETYAYLYSMFSPWLISVHWYGGSLSDEIDSNTSTFKESKSNRFVDFLFRKSIEVVGDH